MRKTGDFRYSVTITNSPLEAQPIKMQDFHESTIYLNPAYSNLAIIVNFSFIFNFEVFYFL